jgi:L-ribulose-5-phosphate 4-epimerase
VASVVSDELRQEVLAANLRIPRAGLATLTWGNVSGVDRDAGVFVIKPSGVAYADLTADSLVVVALENGQVLEGDLRPSVDTETHRSVYLAFPSIGGITHTHSTNAVAFAQARMDMPVLGTTHADTFNGPIRCTDDLTPAQCETDYEYNTGQVIVALFGADDVLAREVPAALVASHGPFTWGVSAMKSLEHAIVCEAVAKIALQTLALHPGARAAQHLLDRHFSRKHGSAAYYGNPATDVRATAAARTDGRRGRA